MNCGISMASVLVFQADQIHYADDEATRRRRGLRRVATHYVDCPHPNWHGNSLTLVPTPLTH